MTKESTIEAQTFRYHRNLNPVVWNMMDMKEDVRNALLTVANKFIESWGFSIPVKDIVLTGSNANYNWTIFSDFDVHVVADMGGFLKGQKEFVTDFLKAKKQLWNANRKIKIRGYPVEVYAQDTEELLVAQGVFSLLTNEWIKKPNRSVPPKPNTLAVRSKVEDFTNQINDAITQGNELSMLAIVKRLSDLRKAGLSSKGEFSTENLAFKVMRNDGTIAKLRAAIETTTDKRLTLEQVEKPKHAKTVWYDRSSRLWSGQWRDHEGNQIGDSEYGPSKKIVHQNLDTSPPGSKERPLEERRVVHFKGTASGKSKKYRFNKDHKGPKHHSSKASKKYKFTNHHKGPKSIGYGGLSNAGRWKKHRAAKIWAWKRNRFSKISKERAASTKNVGRRTYLAGRRIAYKSILGKRSKSKLPYGERRRAERTAERVFKTNVKNPETRYSYKYRRKDTTSHSHVSYKGS